MKKSSAPNRFFIICILVLLFSAPSVFSQLSSFSLSVTPTAETCTGNGQLHFNTTDTTVGASIFYSVFLFPDLTTPIAVINTNALSGLGSGIYRVVAIQTLGAQSNSVQQDIQIQDHRESLIYQCVTQGLNCIVGKITVEVTQGNPVSYEIVSGPITAPAQTSNVFTNLPLGQYLIKVTDDCGDVVVQACTLVFVYESTNLIMTSLYQECYLVDCHTKHIELFVHVPYNENGLPLPGVIVPYPFEVETTVFPPNNGIPVTTTQTITSGDELGQTIGLNIAYYETNTYLINFRIIDPCGNILSTWNGQEINGTKALFLRRQGPKDCYKKIYIDACNLLPPFHVAFLSTPLGFNAADFNTANLGPFNGFITYTSDAQHEIPDGNYVIQLTDACGTTLQDQIIVKNSITDISYPIPVRGFYKECEYQFPVTIGKNGLVPVTVIVTDAPANFDHPLPYDVSFLIEGVPPFFSRNFPIPGHYVIEGVNVCGFPFHFEFDVPPPDIQPFFKANSGFGCNDSAGNISFGLDNGPPLTSVSIILAPPEFNHPLPYDASSFISVSSFPPYSNENFGFQEFLPDGAYAILMTDMCGNVYGPYFAKILIKLYPDPPEVSVLEGCDIGFGSVKVSLPYEANTTLSTVIIMNAPPTFNHTLPYDVSFNIENPNGSFYMNSLPIGTYTFYTKDFCGVAHTFDVEIENHFFDTTAEYEGNCNSFNLFIHNSTNPIQGTVYFVLQKLNPITNQWMHPITGYPFQSGSYPNNINSYLLDYNNYNITSQGKFRVLKLSFIYSNGNSALLPCIKVIKEFDFIGVLKITKAFKISCTTGNSQVLVIAGDTSPLTYKITTKNGQPFLVDNGNSNVFNGLQPGIYNFQVQDGCGNVVNRLFDVSSLAEPVITTSNLCDGQVGQLLTQPFSFLSYQWWKSDDPTTILSTSNVLNFVPFSIPQSLGTYYVRIYSESILSCIDTTISLVIPNPTAPNAGEDSHAIICTADPINMNVLLTGEHDSNGIWSEVTSSGMLNGNIWLPAGIAPGVYNFKYTVNGFCGLFDEAVYTITLQPPLPNPTVNVANSFCVGEAIQFDVNDISNATFQWTGPNNFSSIDQSPVIDHAAIINSGDYIVKATVDQCESSTTVPILIFASPEFKLSTFCDHGNFTLSVMPISDSFHLNDANYHWTGPDNFNSNEAFLILNDLHPGLYSVTVTNIDGCSATQSIPIQNTRCAIPLGVSPNHDTYNETFDLTGFDVLKLVIYSRYGNVVYQRDHYTNQWHGQDFNDRALPDATYYYYIQFKSGEEKTGWVYVSK